MDNSAPESNGDQSTQTSASSAKGPFSDPVYKKLALLNGEVNRMTKTELKTKLESLHLDTRGDVNILKKRFKKYLKDKHLGTKTTRVQERYKYLLVIDFEATCQKDGWNNYNHEIIEFPVVLVDIANKAIVSEFHSFVRPILNPLLSEYCTELTGITQEMVDVAPDFKEVLSLMEEWLVSHNLGKLHKFAIVTDGPWDMSRFMYLQCRTSGLPFPRWARKWVNIRKSYGAAFQAGRIDITTMLNSLGMANEGKLHSGLDDSRNIARIVLKMLNDDYDMCVNQRLSSFKVSEVAEAIHKAKHGSDSPCTPEFVNVDRDELSNDEEAENKE